MTSTHPEYQTAAPKANKNATNQSDLDHGVGNQSQAPGKANKKAQFRGGSCPHHLRAVLNITRKPIWKRDWGVCALCGLHTSRIECLLQICLIGERTRHKQKFIDYFKWAISFDLCGDHKIKNMWEADHIIPVCEGGADSLENIRTLCLPCHHAVTEKLIKWVHGAR